MQMQPMPVQQQVVYEESCCPCCCPPTPVRQVGYGGNRPMVVQQGPMMMGGSCGGRGGSCGGGGGNVGLALAGGLVGGMVLGEMLDGDDGGLF